jgi:cell division protease FtsH
MSDEENRQNKKDDKKPKLPPTRMGRGQFPKKPPNQSRARRTLVFWTILVVFTLLAIQLYKGGQEPETLISYTKFADQIEAGNIQTVTIVESVVHGELIEPIESPDDPERAFRLFRVIVPYDDPELLRQIEEYNKGAVVWAEQESLNWAGILISSLPILLFVALWIFVIRSMRGGSGAGKAFSFGKSGARLLSEDRPKVTFDDVAGLPEAKEELVEIIEFLKDPRKFQRLGGRIPKGVLLLGPPGTGKTLLSKAVAGEAEVPFLSISGSDFVEMFVGVGAARVRDLFEQGKKNAPCIVFIDELDAVGRHRGAGLGGGHDEREQTLNQLLVEMDGFESNEGVILLAATNRPDVLDPALLRPGRFDRQIVVDIPDLKGREEILKVTTKELRMSDDVDFEVIAKGTPGLSGADLANLANEAALLAARSNHDAITMKDFEEAKDKTILGVERRSRIISDDEKRSIAFHEAGHALVAKLIPESDPVHKVTIIPRGLTLGVVHSLPTEDRQIITKSYLLNKICGALGGRAAETIALGEISTGARSDIAMATEMARRMVCEYGMSERLGPIHFGRREEPVFLGKELTRVEDISEATAVTIDEEVKKIVEDQYNRAYNLLNENRAKLDLLAEELLRKETLEGPELDQILNSRGEQKEGASTEGAH